MSERVQAAAHLLAAEAEYLTASKWKPLSPVQPGGEVRWTQRGMGISVCQEEAIRTQKQLDDWPHVKP